MDHEAYLNNRRARYEINLVSAAAIIKEEMKGLEKVTMRLRSNYYRVARNRHQTREGVFIPVVFPIFSIFFFFKSLPLDNTGYLYWIYFRLFSQKINWNSQILFSFIHIGKHFQEKIIVSSVISLFLISMMFLIIVIFSSYSSLGE